MSFSADVCPSRDRRAALEVLYQHLSTAERRQQIDRIERGEAGSPISLDSLLACKAGGVLMGAMLCINGPGRVLMAWLPRIIPECREADRSSVHRALFAASRRLAMTHGARFIQLLADHVPPELEPSLAETGFQYLTQLTFLRRAVSAAESIPTPSADMQYVTFHEGRRTLLSEILERTYRESQDCPELTGVRSMDEVIDSHRGQGEFDPECWFLARRREEWAGCLLLNPTVGKRLLELTYVGVVPEARGGGLGRELVRQSIRIAQHRGDEAIVLAVDRRNHPALAIYESEGFAPWDARDVYWQLVQPRESEGGRSC